MNLKKSFIITILLSVILLGSWEFYWRSQGYYPNLNDNKGIWAIQRGKVEKAGVDDMLVIGASRAYFDIQLREWESETGNLPIQLASQGTTPLPLFHDIVNNTDFAGTILLGVTPVLFFSTTNPEILFWKRGTAKTNYYKNRTYAQRINTNLLLQLEKNFVFMSGDEEKFSDDIDLRSLLRRVRFGDRTESVVIDYYNFGDLDMNRNMSMTIRTSSDTIFANKIKKTWKDILVSGPPPPLDQEGTVNYFLKDLQKFKERGGKLILLRCPSSGFFRGGENKYYPRNDYWDDLVQKANVPGYHFEDYEQLKNFECPEWSHLSAADARTFTTELAKIMLNDGVITNSKIN